ncbi:hypothetical protein ABPG74_010017 [Tetrahymena malaccensis]
MNQPDSPINIENYNRTNQMKQLLKNLNYKLVLHTAGCGSYALKELCINPGSSKVVLEGGQFYARGSLEKELFDKRNIYDKRNLVEKYVSQQTAELMALEAFCKGQNILMRQNEIEEIDKPIGIGITGQIGHHRVNQAYLTIQSMNFLRTFHLTFDDELNGKDQRKEQDVLISDFIFNAIQRYYSSEKTQEWEQLFGKNLKVNLLQERMFDMFEYLDYDDFIHNIVIYKRNTEEFQKRKLSSQNFDESDCKGEFTFAVNQHLDNCVLFSGSFNPIHEAHVQIALESKKLKNRDKIYFEMPLKNADKAIKDRETLLHLVRSIFVKVESSFSDQLKPYQYGIVISKRSLFTEKCSYTANSTFAVGIDTFKRILDNKYYNDSIEDKIATLATFKNSKTDFVVAPRLNPQTNQMEYYDDFIKDTPRFLKDSVIEMKDYRNDISSTQIRTRQRQN